jgi:acyl carrier protein
MSVDTIEKIKTIFKNKLDADPSQVTAEKALVDLGLDSLDMYEMIYEIETEFGVKVPDTEIANLTTVGDLVTYIEKNKS